MHFKTRTVHGILPWGSGTEVDSAYSRRRIGHDGQHMDGPPVGTSLSLSSGSGTDSWERDGDKDI